MNAQITKWSHAYKGYASSYNVEILNSYNPEIQLKDTEYAIENKIIDLFTELKDLKFMTTLALEFKQIENNHKAKDDIFYLNSKAETIINQNDIDGVFESVYTIIISNIQKSIRNGLGWIVDSVIDHSIDISNGKPLAGSSYTKLPNELDHPRRIWLISKI